MHQNRGENKNWGGEGAQSHVHIKSSTLVQRENVNPAGGFGKNTKTVSLTLVASYIYSVLCLILFDVFYVCF